VLVTAIVVRYLGLVASFKWFAGCETVRAVGVERFQLRAKAADVRDGIRQGPQSADIHSSPGTTARCSSCITEVLSGSSACVAASTPARRFTAGSYICTVVAHIQTLNILQTKEAHQAHFTESTRGGKGDISVLSVSERVIYCRRHFELCALRKLHTSSGCSFRLRDSGRCSDLTYNNGCLDVRFNDFC
jgi:hypothetical protein